MDIFMNNNFEKTQQIAHDLGLGQMVSDTMAAIETITSRKSTNVGIVGGQNSGKSHIINAIAGKEVREVSNISIEDEMPLRITFERTEVDPRFECVDIYNKNWNDENVVLFEFKASDIVKNGKLTEYADELDVVFYLISAMSVFTAEDISTLKALKNHMVKIVFTKLDAIEEENRNEVLKYGNDMCVQLGLGEPLIIDKFDAEKNSKILREALPVYMELKEYTEKCCMAHRNALILAVREKINEKIVELDKSYTSVGSIGGNQEVNTQALEMENRIKCLGLERSKRYGENNELANRIVKKMLETGRNNDYSDEWKAGIHRKIVVPLMTEQFDCDNQSIREHMFNDCIGINPTAEETRNLRNKIDEVTKKSVNISEVTDSNINLRDGEGTINFTKIGVTTAVVAGAVLIPMPTALSWLVSAGAIAMGTGAVITEKNRTEMEMWEKNIRNYSKAIAQQFGMSMKKYTNYVYEELAKHVRETIMQENTTMCEQQRQSIRVEKERYLKMLEELG